MAECSGLRLAGRTFAANAARYVQFAVVVILTVLLVQLIGCNRDDASPAPANEITFWSTEGYQREEVELLDKLAKQFESQTGTKVRIQYFTWEEINSKYLAALAAHSPPNIGQHGPDLALRFGQENAVVPVDGIIESIGKDRFHPEFLDDACRYKGRYWSVPWYIEVRSLLIRKDWLAETKLDPPRTWDEWLTICRAMTRDTDGDGEVDRWGFGLYGDDHFGQTWVALAAANGGGLFSRDGDITVDEPANVEALNWFCDLYLKHKVTPPGTRSANWSDMQSYYKRGLVGSLLCNGYILHELSRDAPDLLAESMFVPAPARRAGGRSVSYLGGSHLMLFREAPNRMAAEAFVRFLLDDENYLAFLKTVPGGMLPVLGDVANDPFFQDDANRRVLVRQIQGAVRHQHRGPPHPAVGAAEGELIYGDAQRAVLSGEMTAAQALDRAKQRTEDIFNQQGGQ